MRDQPKQKQNPQNENKYSFKKNTAQKLQPYSPQHPNDESSSTSPNVRNQRTQADCDRLSCQFDMTTTRETGSAPPPPPLPSVTNTTKECPNHRSRQSSRRRAGCFDRGSPTWTKTHAHTFDAWAWVSERASEQNGSRPANNRSWECLVNARIRTRKMYEGQRPGFSEKHGKARSEISFNRNHQNGERRNNTGETCSFVCVF